MNKAAQQLAHKRWAKIPKEHRSAHVPRTGGRPCLYPYKSHRFSAKGIMFTATPPENEGTSPTFTRSTGQTTLSVYHWNIYLARLKPMALPRVAAGKSPMIGIFARKGERRHLQEHPKSGPIFEL
ncbi:MAG: hypothetical protein DMG88_18315 [Acidobacteria bacterium]|nr:MAG: hypothetical protein DMG88_18315 [Acidobacteriota bacterium]